MAATNELPIIIKRVKKGGDHPHHGGAWKVAYADFVTAMMAFFLLLWLLNATTEEQRQGIADYFSPVTVAKGTTGSGGMLGGQTLSPDGAMKNDTAVPSAAPKFTTTGAASEGEADTDTGGGSAGVSDEMAEQIAAKMEEQQFEKAAEAIRQAIQESPDLKELEQHLLIDQTPEGLRIQIVDQDKRSMFPIGSSEMQGWAKELLAKIVQAVKDMPNKVSISGHTDSINFKGDVAGHRNWQLSAGRASTSRQELIAAGLPLDRITMIVGKGDTDHLDPTSPESPRNRRISIVLLRQAKPDAAKAGAAKGAAAPGGGVAPPPKSAVPFERDYGGERLR